MPTALPTFAARIIEAVRNTADWTIDFKADEWLNCNIPIVEIPVSGHFYEQGGIATSATFNACDIGTADANRLVVVVAHVIRSISPGRSIDSVTIGGNAATIHEMLVNENASAGPAAVTSAICSLPVSSGATADIVVTASGNGAGCWIGVYNFIPTSPTPHDSAIAGVNASDPSLTLNVPTSGVVIAAYAGTGGTPAAATWTGLSSTDFNEVTAGTASWWGSAASQTGMSSATGRLISVNAGANGRENIVAASWS